MNNLAMIRKRLNRIIALTLAGILLFSSVSFAFDMHYCQGKMQDMALFGKARTCSPDDLRIPACRHTEDSESSIATFEKKPCCQHASQLWQFDTDYQSTSGMQIQIPAVFPPVQVLQIDVLIGHKSQAFLPDYRPPPRITNHCTWFQVFRI